MITKFEPSSDAYLAIMRSLVCSYDSVAAQDPLPHAAQHALCTSASSMHVYEHLVDINDDDDNYYLKNVARTYLPMINSSICFTMRPLCL